MCYQVYVLLECKKVCNRKRFRNRRGFIPTTQNYILIGNDLYNEHTCSAPGSRCGVNTTALFRFCKRYDLNVFDTRTRSYCVQLWVSQCVAGRRRPSDCKLEKKASRRLGFSWFSNLNTTHHFKKRPSVTLINYLEIDVCLTAISQYHAV